MHEHLLYDISFDIAGVLLVIAVLLIHLMTYRRDSPNSRMFRAFLYVSLLNGLTSILTSFTISYASRVPDSLNMALNICYQIFACLTAYLCLRYVRLCVDERDWVDQLIDTAGAIVYIATLFLNIRFTIMFTFVDHVYIKGPLYQVSYYVQLYYLLHGAILLWRHRRLFTRSQLVLNSFYVLTPIALGVVQIFFPMELLTFFGGAVSALFMVFSLETADYLDLHHSVEGLEQARTEAQDANLAKSEFLARMSHEIRTPINGILGMNEIIMRENRDPEIAEYSAAIESAGRGLLSLINDILDLSRVESGKMELVPTDYQLSSLINDCYFLVASQAAEKGLSFKLDVDPTLPCLVHGDEVRVRQVIVNILNNAVKYTDQGGVVLQITQEREVIPSTPTLPEADSPQDDGTAESDPRTGEVMLLVVSVTDTGIGIRDDQKQLLFENFGRLEDVRNRGIEGTGLGLPIAASLLEAMGGTIEVESEYGRGSTFTVTIPQVVQDGRPIGTLKPGQAEKPGRILRAPRLRVLMVDDVELNLKVACGFLKESRAHIDIATSGADCLRLVREKPYDIIFMDHMMPGMDGVETLRHMRDDPSMRNTDTPVVMMTANAILGAREEYLAEGFVDYLSKPFSQRQLIDCIAAHVYPALLGWEEVDQEDMAPPAKIQETGTRSERAAIVDEATDTAVEPDVDALFARLDFLDTDAALPFCGNSKEFYLELVRDFLAEDRSVRIEECLGNEDWSGYEVQVHALKSAARLIGATELSACALAQEQAAHDGDLEGLRASHPSCLETYKDLHGRLSKLMGVAR